MFKTKWSQICNPYPHKHICTTQYIPSKRPALNNGLDEPGAKYVLCLWLRCFSVTSFSWHLIWKSKGVDAMRDPLFCFQSWWFQWVSHFFLVTLINFNEWIEYFSPKLWLSQCEIRLAVQNPSFRLDLNEVFYQFLFFLSLSVLNGQGICTMTTAFLHFFFLASFCWVLTEAWQSYMAVTGKVRTRLIRKRFLCLGWGKCLDLHNNLCISPSFFLPVSVSFNPSSSCSWYLLLKCGRCEWVIFEYHLVCSIPPRGFLYRTTLRTHQIDYRRANTHPSSYLATNKALSFHHCSVLLCAEEKDKTVEDRQRQICEPFISLAILIHTDGGLIQLLVSMKCFLWASVHGGCFKQDSRFRFI